MRILEKIGSFLFFLVTIPGYMVIGIADGWSVAFETHKRRSSVLNLLMFGSLNLGIYEAGLQVVCQRETIWEEDEIFILNLPSALLRMKVHTWDIRDGKLWIKVCINERLLKELAEAREEKRTKRNIQASSPDVNTLPARKENKMMNENENQAMKCECTEACNCTPCNPYEATVPLMLSPDYKARFVAEYRQTKIRYWKLKAYCDRIEMAMMHHGQVEMPPHDCNLELLRQQQHYMGGYLDVLEKRAIVEGICLD